MGEGLKPWEEAWYKPQEVAEWGGNGKGREGACGAPPVTAGSQDCPLQLCHSRQPNDVLTGYMSLAPRLEAPAHWDGLHWSGTCLLSWRYWGSCPSF